MKRGRKNNRKKYTGKYHANNVVKTSANLSKFSNGLSDLLNNNDTTTYEQFQVMWEMGFTSLTKAKKFAWYKMPISSSAFRILFL